MSVRRMQSIEGEQVVSYVHNAVAPGMGQIVFWSQLTGGATKSWANTDPATHIAAVNPASLSEADLDRGLLLEKRKAGSKMDISTRVRQARSCDRKNDHRS